MSLDLYPYRIDARPELAQARVVDSELPLYLTCKERGTEGVRIKPAVRPRERTEAPPASLDTRKACASAPCGLSRRTGVARRKYVELVL